MCYTPEGVSVMLSSNVQCSKVQSGRAGGMMLITGAAGVIRE